MTALNYLISTLEDALTMRVELKLSPKPKTGFFERLSAEFGDMIIPDGYSTEEWQAMRRERREEVETNYKSLMLGLEERMGECQGIIDAIRKNNPALAKAFPDVRTILRRRASLGTGDDLVDECFETGYIIGYFEMMNKFY